MALVLVLYEDKEIVLDTPVGKVVIHLLPDYSRRNGVKLAFSAPESIAIARRARREFKREVRHTTEGDNL